jgi:hypothetical protein
MLLALTSSLILNAQPIVQSSSSAASGKLSGLILDPGEARAPGAKIIVEGKGLRREVVSADDGSYAIELPEGKYKVRIMLDGFHPSRKKSVRISSNVTTKLDITLKGIRSDESRP